MASATTEDGHDARAQAPEPPVKQCSSQCSHTTHVTSAPHPSPFGPEQTCMYEVYRHPHGGAAFGGGVGGTGGGVPSISIE
jgi:hypothetical protein